MEDLGEGYFPQAYRGHEKFEWALDYVEPFDYFAYFEHSEEKGLASESKNILHEEILAFREAHFESDLNRWPQSVDELMPYADGMTREEVAKYMKHYPGSIITARISTSSASWTMPEIVLRFAAKGGPDSPAWERMESHLAGKEMNPKKRLSLEMHMIPLIDSVPVLMRMFRDAE